MAEGEQTGGACKVKTGQCLTTVLKTKREGCKERGGEIDHEQQERDLSAEKDKNVKEEKKCQKRHMKSRKVLFRFISVCMNHTLPLSEWAASTFTIYYWRYNISHDLYPY